MLTALNIVSVDAVCSGPGRKLFRLCAVNKLICSCPLPGRDGGNLEAYCLGSSMAHRSVPEPFRTDESSPWKIVVRAALLMIGLIAAVWLLRENTQSADQGTQIEHKEKESQNEQPA